MPHASLPPTSRPARTVASAVAALAVIVLAIWIGTRIVSGLAPSGTKVGGRRPAPATTTTSAPPSRPADIAAFLAAERRMLMGTWAVDEQFVRSTPAGTDLTSSVRRVQRPPDSLSQSPQTADVQRAGRHLACASAPTGGLVCRDIGPAPPWAQQVDDQVATWRSYLVAALPLYRVVAAPAAGPGRCWRLDLAAPLYPTPPYGGQATFCFDPVTGAPSYAEVRRGTTVDTTNVVDIRAVVTITDLSVIGATGAGA